MREVSPLQLITILIVTLINFGFFILSCILGGALLFIFLTSLAHWSNTVYLCVVCICDISVFFFKSDKLEKVNEFMRNTYSIFSFTFEYTVTVLYWMLVLLGDSFMTFYTENALMLSFFIYLHGIITLFLLFDLVLFNHQKITWSNSHVMILSGLYLIYFIIVSISKFGYGINPYPFLVNASVGQLIVCIVAFYIIVVNSYQSHIWFLKIKNDIQMKSISNYNNESKVELKEPINT